MMFFKKTAFALILALFAVAPALSSVQAQTGLTPEQQELMQQMQKMQEQMQGYQNNEQLQEQMRKMQEMFSQQGMSGYDYQGAMGMVGALNKYNNCISSGLGQDWLLSMGARMSPYIEEIQGLCEAGQYSAAKSFVMDERNVKALFDEREMQVMEQCRAQFPDQASLGLDVPKDKSGEELCQDFTY